MLYSRCWLMQNLFLKMYINEYFVFKCCTHDERPNLPNIHAFYVLFWITIIFTQIIIMMYNYTPFLDYRLHQITCNQLQSITITDYDYPMSARQLATYIPYRIQCKMMVPHCIPITLYPYGHNILMSSARPATFNIFYQYVKQYSSNFVFVFN